MKFYSLTLASQSPRRSEIIASSKLIRAVCVPSVNVDESFNESEGVENIVVRLAKSKAADVLNRCGGLVLGADTLVSLDGVILGKPKSAREAIGMFRLLCGKTHEVATGICLMKENKTVTACEKSFVTFGAFDTELINAYIATGKPFDKAGGYGIQDAELAPLILNVTGDINNVIGLPLALTEKLLEENF